MIVVVADSGPLRYLIQIGHVELLPKLFSRIFVPERVAAELRHASAPVAVRSWLSQPPDWLEVSGSGLTDDPDLAGLDIGERSAILLAGQLRAALVLMDDRRGVAAARARGLTVTGTLGVLDLAARRGMIDIREAVDRLRATNFRCREEILAALQAGHGRG